MEKTNLITTIEFNNLISIAMLACLIVLVAMIVDLISGLSKAKQRGEYTSSNALKRTLNKFVMYEGGMVIAICIDVLLHFSHLHQLFRLDAIYGVPVVTQLVGIFLCIVEYLSVREKADKKTRTEFARVEERVSELAKKYITKDELLQVLTDIVRENNQARTGGSDESINNGATG